MKIDIDSAPTLARAAAREVGADVHGRSPSSASSDGVVGAIGKKKMREMVEPFLPRAEGALKPLELAQLLREGAVVPVDTRDAAAFRRAHIPGAVNMPLEEIEGAAGRAAHAPGAAGPLLPRGGQDQGSRRRLAEQGLPVAFLEGGFLAWESEGLPIERG